MREIKEACGVFGIYTKEQAQDVATSTYYGLYALQHRGQESCGIVVNDDGVFHTHVDNGTASEVFDADTLKSLGLGNMAIGHVRLGTSNTKGIANAQPLVVNHIKGQMALAHNGTLTNSVELKREFELKGSIFRTSSDAEIMTYLITNERLTAPSIEEALNRAMYRLKGAYAILIMSPQKMVACRDEYGMKPICYGQKPDGTYVIASESCALNAVGAKLIRDLEPGEIIVIKDGDVSFIKDHCNKKPRASCVFEYIYTARPDSVMDGTSVHDARVRAGEFLAQEHPVDADVIIGVPDSGLDAATGYARASGIPYEVGILKNKYIGRTFIVPGQKTRENMVRIKLNPIESVIKGKKIVLVDDSIVRGTTLQRLVSLVRETGAKEIHLRISSPPFVCPCYYGTDVDSKDKLIACRHNSDMELIAKELGADSVGYLSVEHAKQLATEKGLTFCTACFDGIYPIEPPKPLDPNDIHLDRKLSEKPKKKED